MWNLIQLIKQNIKADEAAAVHTDGSSSLERRIKTGLFAAFLLTPVMTTARPVWAAWVTDAS